MGIDGINTKRSEEHTSELQSLRHLVCRLLLEKTKSCVPGMFILSIVVASGSVDIEMRRPAPGPRFRVRVSLLNQSSDTAFHFLPFLYIFGQPIFHTVPPSRPIST